jgi:uncharacterized membrane protein
MTSAAPDTGREPFDLGDVPQPDLPPAGHNDRILAGLAYASQIVFPAVLPVVLLVSDETRRSTYLRYHAAQSLGLLIASILYYLAAAVVYVVIAAIASCLTCLSWALFLVPAATMVYYGWMAYRDGYVEIPWLTDFMKQNAWL